MTRWTKILRLAGTLLFGFGFLLTGLVGTAPDVPFHLLGLPFCGVGACLLGAEAFLARRAMASAWIVPVVAVPLIYFAIRAWHSPVRHLAEMDLFLMAAFVVGMAAVAFAGHGRWLVPWAVALAVGGLAISAYQIFVDHRFCALAFLSLKRPMDEPTASGFFYNRNPFGAWSAMLLLWFTALLIWGKHKRHLVVLLIIGIAASGLGLLASFSRAALFGAGMGAALMVVGGLVIVANLRISLLRKAVIGIGLFGVVAAAAAFAAWWLPKLMEKRFGDGELALAWLNGRLGIWRTGMNQFLEHTSVGAGSRSFSYLSYRYWDSSLWIGSHDPWYAHNEYVQILADYGIIGLLVLLPALFVILIIAPALASRLVKSDSTRKGKWEAGWCLGMAAALAALMADCFFSFNAHFAPQALLTGALAGGLVSAGRGGRKATKPSMANLAVQAFLASLAVAAAFFLIHPGIAQARATAILFLSYDAYDRGRITSGQYLEHGRLAASKCPRFPYFERNGRLCLWAARDAATQPEEDALLLEALHWTDLAVKSHPHDAESRLRRASLLNKKGNYQAADEDFRAAVELTHRREWYFRTWTRMGEAYHDRAKRWWAEGDMDSTCRALRDALKAYERSNKILWARNDPKWVRGKKQVEETIAFLRRTGEWAAQ